jgi:uncharacterized protein YndB with AHSA1/START domain
MGPPDGSMSIRELDLKVGGGYRFVWRGADGAETGERGVYREIVPPERIVSADAFDDWYPGEALVTTTFVEQGGSTTVTTTVLYPFNAVRDTVLKSDLETALAACYRKLTELLEVFASSALAEFERLESLAQPNANLLDMARPGRR